jgi:hypothetical protein
METWKSSNPRRAITCNYGVFENKSNLNSLQSYQHPLPIRKHVELLEEHHWCLFFNMHTDEKNYSLIVVGNQTNL